MDLKVDPARWPEDPPGTSIFVRALHEGKWESVDIVTLEKESLLERLRSRGGNNPYAEDVVGILFGHGHLHPIILPDEEAKPLTETTYQEPPTLQLKDVSGACALCSFATRTDDPQVSYMQEKGPEFACKFRGSVHKYGHCQAYHGQKIHL